MKKIYIFSFATFFFFFLIYFSINIFFPISKKDVFFEENHIDYSKYEEKDWYYLVDIINNDTSYTGALLVWDELIKAEELSAKDLEIKERKLKLIDHLRLEKNKINYIFNFYPDSIKTKYSNYEELFESILLSSFFENKISSIEISMYDDKFDVRWKMQSKEIKLFWLNQIEEDELTSVFIHELSHYIDLYYFDKINSNDLSDKFYDISWNSTYVIKKWQLQKDFVSGYAMTNKYEDFAEACTYYLLHNDDFKLKAEKSALLQKKYDFFSRYLFKNKEFIWTDFSENNKIEDYYWDITKIKIKTNNFLQYLENTI